MRFTQEVNVLGKKIVIFDLLAVGESFIFPSMTEFGGVQISTPVFMKIAKNEALNMKTRLAKQLSPESLVVRVRVGDAKVVLDKQKLPK